ncbi:MAG: phospholipase D family protein [Thermodesulfobacteriota bacterium]|nr:phospholipase D family protein [Thermodesulfobacteriota bacterium]
MNHKAPERISFNIQRELKRTLFCIVIALILPFVHDAKEAQGKETIEVYFSPQGRCEKAIIQEIENAKDSIHIAMFHFTNGRIARALTKASKKGIDVKVILDKEKASGSYSKSKFLLNKGLHIQFREGIQRRGRDNKIGLMHNKFVIIDGKIVITGSYNWTASAELWNYENLLIIWSAKIAKLFEMEFMRLWTKK